jgi:hypothetical protein
MKTKGLQSKEDDPRCLIRVTRSMRKRLKQDALDADMPMIMFLDMLLDFYEEGRP